MSRVDKTTDVSYEWTFQFLWNTCIASIITCMHVLFSGAVTLVPASLAVHSLNLFVCAYVVVCVCVLFVCGSLKFEGGVVVVKVLQQHFHCRK